MHPGAINRTVVIYKLIAKDPNRAFGRRDMEKAMKKRNLAGAIFGKVLRTRELSLGLLIIMVIIVLMTQTSNFANAGNVRVLLQGMSVDMMIAIPMAISLIAGNIDFSVGSTLCLTSAVAGIVMNAGAPAIVGIAVGLVLGGLLGFLNAIIINKLKVTPLVATLGTWMAYRGIALVVIGGTVANMPADFANFGRVEPLGIPITIIYMVLIVVAGILLIRYSSFFHNAYYIGSNKISARLAGINNEKFIYASYTITGMIAAFAGLVLAARLGSASQNAGEGLEFRNVVGLLVGGVSMDGGEGSLIGAVMGIIMMQIVNNAIVLLYLNPSYTKVITGAILVLAVALDQFNKQKKMRGR
jgi:ribose transport system permease protein